MTLFADTRRDSFDARDRVYTSFRPVVPDTLLPLPHLVAARQQQAEGDGPGYALATTIDCLLQRAGHAGSVSARMLVETGRRYDRWPGLDARSSSARAVLQAWHKHGVCSEAAWPSDHPQDTTLDRHRQAQALQWPLRQYWRVLPRRCEVQAALCECGALLATAAFHDGWRQPLQGLIAAAPGARPEAGHAVTLVGYEPRGFLVLAPGGVGWGGLPLAGLARPGLALWPYEDFDAHVWDVWAVALAQPVPQMAALHGGRPRAALSGLVGGPRPAEVAQHLVHIDDGQFVPDGDYASTAAGVRELLHAKVQAGVARGALNLLLIAHGGLNTLNRAANRVRAWRDVIDDNGIEHLHWLWETGFIEELGDVLLGKDRYATERAGLGEWKDRLLERLTRPLGKALWREMQSDAAAAHADDGAGAQVLALLAEALAAPQAAGLPVRITLLADSAGSLWLGEALQAWARLLPGRPVDHLVLMAPACSVDFYRRRLHPPLAAGWVKVLTVFQLPDALERDDNVALVYGKSMLYYVSNACEAREGGTPVLGLQACNPHWQAEREALRQQGRFTLYTATEDREQCRATQHNGFDDDPYTLNTVLRLAAGGPLARPFTADDLAGQ